MGDVIITVVRNTNQWDITVASDPSEPSMITIFHGVVSVNGPDDNCGTDEVYTGIPNDLVLGCSMATFTPGFPNPSGSMTANISDEGTADLSFCCNDINHCASSCDPTLATPVITLGAGTHHPGTWAGTYVFVGFCDPGETGTTNFPDPAGNCAWLFQNAAAPGEYLEIQHNKGSPPASTSGHLWMARLVDTDIRYGGVVFTGPAPITAFGGCSEPPLTNSAGWASLGVNICNTGCIEGTFVLPATVLSGTPPTGFVTVTL
jgi:hypothetical protein